ncbi:Abi family protein [Bifidobacterium animalis]|uniref:Abi family protein n=1 Tax=Bifidobacterium animalis TaxID=28025 RepID=UPI001C3ED047|nr:Abi family protein [Bifidobacterium animalis]MCR1995699.1 Abi family protein [Bifidobacterium animalis subsp. animalis]
MNRDSTPHASGNGANQAGSFLFPKPPLTIAEQREHLRERGLDLGNRPADGVESFLASNNYYRVSGYWLTFFDKTAGRFVEGTTLDDIIHVMAFDYELRFMLFRMIEPLEIKFRTSFAYYMSQMHGAVAYRDGRLFNSKKAFERSQVKIDHAIDVSVRGRVPCVTHNMEKYGQLPVWALVEVLSFGTVSKMYGNLFDSKLRDAVAADFQTTATLLKSWMEHLVYIRNLCAHYDRLYNRIVTKRPQFLEEDKQLFDRLHLQRGRLFDTFIVLKHLYEHFDPTMWDVRMKELHRLIAMYPEVSLAPLGFPDDWLDVLFIEEAGFPVK